MIFTRKAKEKENRKTRSREIIKITFWLMIHFSVKIGLNLAFSPRPGNDLPKKQTKRSIKSLSVSSFH